MMHPLLLSFLKGLYSCEPSKRSLAKKSPKQEARTMENEERYSNELSSIEAIFSDESLDEELGYPEDHEYYED